MKISQLMRQARVKPWLMQENTVDPVLYGAYFGPKIVEHSIAVIANCPPEAKKLAQSQIAKRVRCSAIESKLAANAIWAIKLSPNTHLKET